MEGSTKGQVIVNGDDFGLSPGVNEAIRTLHKKGRLNSVSIMVNMPWSPEALAYARSAADLRLGLHLNLTTGRPVLPAGRVPTLVDGRGSFYDLSALLSRLVAGRINRSEIRAELAAQMETCLKSGLRPTHVDSHMHFHALPSLGQMVVDLAGRFGVGAVRNPDVSAFVLPPFGRKRPVEQALHKTGSTVLKSAQNMLARRHILLNGPDSRADQLIYLRWCLNLAGDPAGAFRDCLAELDGRSLEIIAHPALPDRELRALSNYVEGRQRELAFLSGEQYAALLDSFF